MIRPGKDCDVFPSHGEFIFAYAQEEWVVFENEAGETQRVRSSEPLLYLRGIAHNNFLWAIGQANFSGNALMVNSAGQIFALGTTHGQNCVALHSDGLHLRAFIQRSKDRFSIVTIDGGVEDLPIPTGETSQGFRDILPDGTIIWGDQAHVRHLHKRTLHAPMQRGPLVVGQADPPRILAAFEPREHVFTAIEGLAWEPHVAQIGERFAVCARTPAGSHLEIFTPPYPPHEPLVVVPPTPEPIPPIQPMPESLLPTVIAIRAKYPNPSQADLGAILNEIAWIHRVDGWGVNRKTGGNHTLQPRTGERIAVDILHHKPTDTIWDCFGDAGGATTPTWGHAEPHGDPTRIWLPPVAPVETPLPEPGPTPTPIPVDLILAAIDVLSRHIDALEGKVDDLNAKLDLLLSKPCPKKLTGTLNGLKFVGSGRIDGTLE